MISGFIRIGGIQDYALTEGLHFRVPWFQVGHGKNPLYNYDLFDLIFHICTDNLNHKLRKRIAGHHLK